MAEDKLHCGVSIMSAVSTEKLRLVLFGKSCGIRSTKPLLQILVRISQLAQHVNYTSSRLTNGSGEQQDIFGMLDMSNGQLWMPAALLPARLSASPAAPRLHQDVLSL